MGADMQKHQREVSDVNLAAAQVVREWKASGRRFSAEWFIARRNEILDNR
jgi:hypothetical protein